VTNSYDVLLRRTNLAIASASVSYGYDNASRLQTVSDTVGSANYSYLTNSSLVGQISYTGSGTPEMTTTRTYDLPPKGNGVLHL
jgi:hypothetical protein